MASILLMQEFFLTLLAILALCAALPPSRWGVRLWLAVAMILGTLRLIKPEVAAFAGSDRLDELLDWVVAFFLAATLGGIGLRWGLEQAKGNAFGSQSRTEERSDMLSFADQLLAVFAGVCGSYFLVLGVALAMRGLPGGLTLHFALFVLAGSLAVQAVHDLRGPIRTAAVTALSVLAIMALVGGLYWPILVAKRAAEIRPDLPRCLRAIDRLAKAEDTMLFTLPLGLPKVPGLILTVIHPSGGIGYYRWSYRAMRFVQYGTWSGDYYHLGPCPEK